MNDLMTRSLSTHAQSAGFPYASPEDTDRSSALVATVARYAALLDANGTINQYCNKAVGEASADNYDLSSAGWASLFLQGDRNIYTWGNEITNRRSSNECSNLYRVVARANTVLQALETLDRAPANARSWDALKGSALFWRADAFHNLLRNHALAYHGATAPRIPGIPLPLLPAHARLRSPATLHDSYCQVIADLQAAIPLLPAIPLNKLKPARSAGHALLGRVWLSMGAFAEAERSIDSALGVSDELMDYHEMNPAAALPFRAFNTETIYHAHGGNALLSIGRARIDPKLYAMYDRHDLRKRLFFKQNEDGTQAFKGHYSGIESVLFVGIATDELYLAKAECRARAGDAPSAMRTLNALLVKRWRRGWFRPLAASTAAHALTVVLQERRKQLLFRDLRWMDIKRLNREGAGIGIQRVLNERTFVLPPNDPRFALPLRHGTEDVSHEEKKTP